MKKLSVFSILIFLTLHLSAQVKLDIVGDAKIDGNLDLSSPGNNIFLGIDAGGSTTTGTFNTFIGQAAGALNDEGEQNTFMGVLAGFTNSSGSYNTFLGLSAGLANDDGSHNTFVGMDAGRSSTGSNNTFVGKDAGKNTAGANASWNTFVGKSAGLLTTTGQNNVFIGYSAGSGNTAGRGNVLVGNETGGHIGFIGNFNTFMGNQAGWRNTTGGRNTFLATDAGSSNTEGDNNTFVGISAGFSNTTGSDNTFVGHNAGAGNEEGNSLEAFGVNAAAGIGGGTPMENSFAIGSNSLMRKSHSGVLGNISVQEIGGYVNWSTASDGRMKSVVLEDVKGLDFVLQLRPVSYQVNAEKLNDFLRSGMEEKRLTPSEEMDESQKKVKAKGKAVYQNALEEKSKIRYTGFIAQEVEKAMNTSGFEFSGLVKPANDQDHYSLRYSEFVVPLVKATQEQQELIEAQQQKINQLQTEVTDLKVLVRQLLANN